MLLRVERVDDVALQVLVVAVQARAVMRDAAEVLDILDGVVRGNAHDGAELVTAAFVFGRMALATDPAVALEDGVVLVTCLLQVHACGKAGRATADDRDAYVLIH